MSLKPSRFGCTWRDVCAGGAYLLVGAIMFLASIAVGALAAAVITALFIRPPE